MRESIQNFITIWLGAALASFALGQSEDEGEAFEFTTRAFGDDFFEGIQYYNAEGERETLAFDPYRRTGIYRAPLGLSAIEFVRVRVDDRGRESEERIAVADLSEIESRAFLVFFAERDYERNLPYRIYVADESPGEFEAGHVRFLNLSGPPLLARVGDETFSLDMGFGGDLQFDPEAIEEQPFEFAVRVGDEWKIVYSTGFRAHPEVGTVAILKPPVTLGSLRLQVELSQRRYYFDPVEEAESGE